MNLTFKIAVAIIVSFVAIVVLVIAVGYSLPKSHIAARAVSLGQKPADVFALISDFKNGAAWRSDLQAVELLQPESGRTRFREKGPNGNLTFEVIEFKSPERLTTQIADKNLLFGGTWTFEILPAASGTRLNITERGEIYNPVFRFASRFILGYNRTLDTYLRNVSRKFNETAEPQAGPTRFRFSSATNSQVRPTAFHAMLRKI
jgi:hypothetical protein